MRAHEAAASRPVRAPEMDEVLHRARLDDRKRKRTYEAALRSLPNGAFVEIEQAPYLLWKDVLALRTPEGYTKKERRPGGLTVTVLTPQPIVECFREGYEPEVHRSFCAVNL